VKKNRNIRMVSRLLQAAAEAMADAYAPYSRFRVGAALLASNQKIYTGCNVENVSYGLTICAERVAAVKAVADGQREFRAVAIVSDGTTPPFPCGACRQFLAEFALPGMIVAAATRKDLADPRLLTLRELLPHAFRLDKKGTTSRRASR